MKTIYTKGNLSYELASSENEYNEFLERMKGWMQELKKRGYGGPLRLDDGIDISLGPELRNNDTYFAEYEGPTINGKGCRFCGPDGTRYVIMPGTLQTDINNIKESKNMKKNAVKLNEAQLRSMVMEVTRQALKDMKGATKDVHAKANEQSPEEKKYNRATSKPKPSHWKPLGKSDYENMRNGNVDGLSDKAVNMLHATMNNDDKAYRKAKYGELKEDTNMDTPKFDNVDNDQIPADGNYTDILVPEHCLNYLVNGDLTGYEDDEIEAMQRFESKWAGRIANGLIIGDICIPMEGRHPSFEPKNDVYGWLGCDCYRFMVPLNGSEEDTVNNNEPVKLSESQLRQMIAESVKKVLKESFEDYYEYIDDNIKKILEHIHGITDALFQIHETANVKGKDFVNFDDIITTLMMNATDFRDDVMEMGAKYGLVKVRKTFY